MMRYVNIQNLNDVDRRSGIISEIGMGTTSFWSGNNAGLETCIRKAVREYGITVLDTAEMYGNGRCESALGRTIRSLDRNKLYIVDKILPSHVKKDTFRKRLEGSLARLQAEYIDLYLLHWRENADLQLMVDEMEEAVEDGLIHSWGVSNFSVKDMEDLLRCDRGAHCFCNQFFYCLYERGPEFDLIPLLKENGILPMAYSSLGSDYYPHDDIHKNKKIMSECRKADVTPESIMLKLVTAHGAVALFQTTSLQHLDENLKEVPEALYEELRQVFEEAYPAPSSARELVKI
ncbi:MAG: aldo/keto reductase [Lachnospiraceae bacterium]|nr:aldo/keto reductase [Lachnospiraceae bacterium]